MESIRISKDESNMIKGVAVILMMVHHFWSGMQPIPSKIAIMGGVIPNVELYIGAMCKICVSLFAFLTGWVLYLNPKYRSYKYNFTKAKSFVLDYWIVEFIFILVGVAFCLKLPSLPIFFANLFGFKTGSFEVMGYDYVNVTHAWYVRFYLSMLLSFPLLLKALDIMDRIPSVLSFVFLLLLCGSMRYYCQNSESYVFKLVAVYSEWLPCVLAGYYFNRYGWYKWFRQIKLPIWIFLLLGYLMLRDKMPLGYNSDWIGAPILIYVCLRLIPMEKSEQLVKLGKISMFIWFVHGLFFLPTKPLESLILIKGNTFILLFLGIFWSILLSFLIVSMKEKIIKWYCKC